MSPVPAISVVLPTHNGSRYLDQAVASMVGQTCRDWELVLVDDASTDDTPARVDAWSARDARIQAVHLSDNRRLPGALNEGFRRTRGELLSWTSDDNWYHPDALVRMRDRLAARPEVDVVYAAATKVDPAGTPLRVEPASPPEALAEYNCVGACFLYRRRVHEALDGYDESLFLAEDYDFWLRAYLRFRLEPLDQPLYYYREHAGSLTALRRREISLAAEEAVRRFLQQGKSLSRRTRGRALEATGLRALQRGNVWTGRRFLLQAMLLSGRLPRFRGCRSYAFDFFFGRAVGNALRKQWAVGGGQ
jgi:glycosyltransferase involved in cell wall biosynthesis